MNTRRGFFKTLAGIVVGGAGAAVAGPNLKLQNKRISAIQTVNEGLNKDWDGKITLRHLEEAYQHCSIGADEPNVIYVSPKSLNWIKAQMSPNQRFFAASGPNADEVSGLAFNRAIITTPWLGSSQYAVNSDKEIMVVNRHRPYAPFTQRFRLLGDQLTSLTPTMQVGGSYSKGSSFSISKPEHYTYGFTGFRNGGVRG